MVTTDLVHPDVLTLAQLLLAEWPAVRERIYLSGHPTCEGDDDKDADADADADKDADADADADADDDKDDDDKDDEPNQPDWKKLARRHEREAKAARKREADLQTKLKQRDDADKTEQQKAIDKAREEATAEVTTKYEAQQRTDRIENAVTKLSLRGFKAKDSDGKELTLKFADPDDAQLRLDRALRNGELAHEDIYVDGKVQAAAITDFLSELLEEHPRLRAQENGGGKSGAVDFDAGKGKGTGGKTLSEMSPDDHLKELQGRR